MCSHARPCCASTACKTFPPPSQWHRPTSPSHISTTFQETLPTNFLYHPPQHSATPKVCPPRYHHQIWRQFARSYLLWFLGGAQESAAFAAIGSRHASSAALEKCSPTVFPPRLSKGWPRSNAAPWAELGKAKALVARRSELISKATGRRKPLSTPIGWVVPLFIPALTNLDPRLQRRRKLRRSTCQVRCYFSRIWKSCVPCAKSKINLEIRVVAHFSQWNPGSTAIVHQAIQKNQGGAQQCHLAGHPKKLRRSDPAHELDKAWHLYALNSRSRWFGEQWCFQSGRFEASAPLLLVQFELFLKWFREMVVCPVRKLETYENVLSQQTIAKNNTFFASLIMSFSLGRKHCVVRTLCCQASLAHMYRALAAGRYFFNFSPSQGFAEGGARTGRPPQQAAPDADMAMPLSEVEEEIIRVLSNSNTFNSHTKNLVDQGGSWTNPCGTQAKRCSWSIPH